VIGMAAERKVRQRCAAFAVALSVVIVLTRTGIAQNAAPVPSPKACAERLQPRAGDTPRLSGPADEQLSDKLDRSEGVICPPAGVDPEIAAPPPGGGNTPVIPPPGSPGGDPSVRPKMP
jgi:hypothetical protein